MRDLRTTGLRIEAADGTVLEFDVSFREAHSLPTNVTQYPVEGDFPMADGVQLLPRKFAAEVLTSTAPSIGTPSATRDIDMGASLVRLRNAKQLLRLVTEDGVLDNMVLEDLSWERTGETGEALLPTLSFVQITIATRLTARIPPIVRPRRARGQQGGVLYSRETGTCIPISEPMSEVDPLSQRQGEDASLLAETRRTRPVVISSTATQQARTLSPASLGTDRLPGWSSSSRVVLY